MRALVVALVLAGCSRDEPTVRADRTKRLPPPPSVSEVPMPVPLPPAPSPSPSPSVSASASVAPPPPFDSAAARAAIAAVKYKHCGLPRSVRVILELDDTGRATVTKVGTVDPLPSTVELCLIKAFERATVPPFSGAPVTIATFARP